MVGTEERERRDQTVFMMSEAGLSITLGSGSSVDDFPVRVGVHNLINGFYIEGQQVLLTAVWKI